MSLYKNLSKLKLIQSIVFITLTCVLFQVTGNTFCAQTQGSQEAWLRSDVVVRRQLTASTYEIVAGVFVGVLLNFMTKEKVLHHEAAHFINLLRKLDFTRCFEQFNFFRRSLNFNLPLDRHSKF